MARHRSGLCGRNRRPAGRDHAAGALGHEVVLQAGANALQVCVQSGVVEVVGARSCGAVLAACSARRSIRSSWRASAASCSRLRRGHRRRRQAAAPRTAQPPRRQAQAARMCGGYCVPSCPSRLKRMDRCCPTRPPAPRGIELRLDRIYRPPQKGEIPALKFKLEALGAFAARIWIAGSSKASTGRSRRPSERG